MPKIHTLVIVGVGLIGGSFALDMKRAGQVQKVIGVGRSRGNLTRALELGVIDEASQDVTDACKQADLILLATPVGQMKNTLSAISPILSPHTIITDAGSTKADVVRLMRTYLKPQQLSQCVPAHPIAGSELSGATAAQYGLYQGRKVVLTPLLETAPSALSTVQSFWETCGAEIHTLGATEHDSILACVSHLPHLLAFTYVDLIADKPNADHYFDFASTGFRDFTRIAGSHPEMWRDISLANKTALLTQLRQYQQYLDKLMACLEQENNTILTELFEQAHNARSAWFQNFQKNNNSR